MPDLALNYSYGIDAPQFASNGPDGARNLGYSASATVDVPIWDWLTSERKVKEARIRAQASKIALDAAQRRMLADLTEFYNEADIARQLLASSMPAWPMLAKPCDSPTFAMSMAKAPCSTWSTLKIRWWQPRTAKSMVSFATTWRWPSLKRLQEGSSP